MDAIDIFRVSTQDLASAADAARVDLTAAWDDSAKDTYCDSASADGHGAVDAAASAAQRSSWLYATGKRREARALLADGWKHHARADEAVAWLRNHSAD